MGDGRRHGGQPDQPPHRRNGGMRAIQQAQFHRLERGDIGGEFHPRNLPFRAAKGKVILDHPLEKRLGQHRPGIGQAKLGCNHGAVGIGCGRNNPVHHAGRTGDIVPDKPTQTGVAAFSELDQQAVGQLAIGGQVVTGQHSKGRNPRRPPQRQRLHHKAQCGAGSVGIGQIMLHIRIIQPQLCAGQIDRVSLFSDGQRHDPDAGVSHGGQQSLRVFRGDQYPGQRADHLQGLTVTLPQGQRVKPILRGQRIARIGTAQ